MILSWWMAAVQADTLRLGIFPYFSAEQLVSLHRPLKDFLARHCGLSIRLVSAADFRTFKHRTAKGRYDLLVTAPHLGRVAEQQVGYRWLGITANHSEAVFVALEDSPVKVLTDLRGRRLALPPRLAIIHQMALETLENLDFEPAKDMILLVRRSHDLALYSVLRGDADAAVVGRPTWLRYQAPGKEHLRVIGRSAAIPGFAIMTHPRLAPTMQDCLREALWRFAETQEGKAYFHATGLKGVRDIEVRDKALLDHFLDRIKTARESALN